MITTRLFLMSIFLAGIASFIGRGGSLGSYFVR